MYVHGCHLIGRRAEMARLAFKPVTAAAIRLGRVVAEGAFAGGVARIDRNALTSVAFALVRELAPDFSKANLEHRPV